MVVCLTGAKFTMEAEVLRWEGQTIPTSKDVYQGEWDTYQDPITGEILNRWVPGTEDNPITTTIDEYSAIRTIRCLARGVVNGGTRLSGSSEHFGDTYDSVDMVRLWIPAKTVLHKNERITNIRARVGGRVLWTEEDGAPTIFNVSGITPLFDPFNNHTQTYVNLERAD